MGHIIEPITFDEVTKAGTFVSSIASSACPGFYKRLLIETEITKDGPVSNYLVGTKDKPVVTRTKDINKAIHVYNQLQPC